MVADRNGAGGKSGEDLGLLGRDVLFPASVVLG